jgi:ubiquinone/menaquinone biosynthesis C-methylase UbiE
MSDVAFRLMNATFTLIDLFSTKIDQRVLTFGIQDGMTVIDYGCGPGRYATRFSKLVGESGKVFAIDIQPLALEAVKRKMQQQGRHNIVPVLTDGYNTGLPDHAADIACVIDMFFGVKDPSALLREVHRIIKTEGTLVIDDGHPSRATTLQKIKAATGWRIIEETRDHLKCKPV